MYAGFAALSFFFILWKVPETKGMDLEQTETLFHRPAKAMEG
jgi:SP family sugar:H+ symporter-like MFS transporter